MKNPLILALLCLAHAIAVAADPPNVLIITVDDMSCDSVGVFGCRLADTTPRLDRFAAQAMRFDYAHTVVGNCMPSRNVMWSGRYPHNNHVEGFKSIARAQTDYPVLGDLMKAGGWFTGIRHKVSHSTPYLPFPWDIDLDRDAAGGKPHVKDPPTYGAALRRGIEAARKAGKPFCLMLNIADPHKPFYSEGARGQTVDDPHVPSRVFAPDEVPVPGFLPDDPVTRKELAQYYSSVRRADDAVGAILDALQQSGEEERTVVVFLSDHGMPLPFAKTQLYHHSTRTPLMIRWPGVTQPGAVDDEHMVSTVDLLPTLLDIVGVEKPTGFDGRSFAGLLKGEKQSGWDIVFKEHNENAGGQRTPMRAVETRDWLYVFSPWSNGTRVMSGATAGTATCRQMRVLAKKDPKIAARVELFDHRVPEEAYQVKYDADALDNRIADPRYATEVAAMEKALEDWMVRTRDPLLEVFRKRDDAAFREAAIRQIEQRAVPRKKRAAAQAGAGAANAAGAMARKQGGALIELDPPTAIASGEPVKIRIRHHFPDALGERPIQITLKGGNNARLERKTVNASGTGEVEVTFDLPAEIPGGAVIFAGLVGDNISNALQHVQTRPIPVK